MRELINGDKESREIWSKNHDVITSDRLQKFWSQLTLQEKRMLLRIDKQSLIEQARKNLYCSRCNGLLLEGFAQIVRYARAVQQYGDEPQLTNSSDSELDDIHNPLPDDDILNPAVHPWGGLAATKDGLLTILDIFVNYSSMEPLQNVFNCARAREHEREFQFPDACGGRGRGWISQGISTNGGRGHTIRETCALHTARLPCDVLIDYWLDLGEEMQISLLQMKEEDFIERLMHRFDCKRFCKDCRRNVIREFKELKELKRMRREPRCTSWFCVADTAFQYEISEDTVQADWHEFFTDTITTYHHFEWAVGTGEGKSDILEFKNVGLSRSVQVSGLDLGDLNSCFITLRAWKSKDRYTEFCVKAHALKGQPCVHRRLLIGDGFVTITKGESIKSFFEIAEEIEEEEDDYALDKDGNDMDGDGPWPQKHAKSPELAREFLLDAATVIFKEQVEKSYREHTAQQNAHSVFVSLALNLLEERIHVACKEIITLEKQMKLLEEEEREKREEEERRERKRIKEKEKKNRRKEKRKGKEKETENKQIESNHEPLVSPVTVDHPASTTVETATPDPDHDEITTPHINIENHNDEITAPHINIENHNDVITAPHINIENHNDENLDVSDSSGNFVLEQSKSTRRKLRSKKEMSNWYNSTMDHDNGREKPLNPHLRDCNPKHSDKYKYYQSCACNSKDVYQTPSNKTLPYRGSSVPPKGKVPFKQVWEPVGSRTPVFANKTKENQLSNCEDCDGNSKTSSNSFVSTPMKNSSSSDNCSSCLSSSSSQNTESSSTSDSEDISPHSHKSDDFAGKSKTNEECKSADLLANDKVNNVATHSQPQASLPLLMHNHSVHMPVYPSPAMYQGTFNEFVPYQHVNQFIFPSSNILYNFQPMPYNLTPPLYNEPNNMINVVKAVPNVKASNAPRTEEDSSPFSLFHFGGPVAGPRGFNVSCGKERITCWMENTPIKQYSLFP